MNNQEITDKYYKEAVKGLDELILQDKELWYKYVINLPIHLQVVYTVVVFHQQVFNGGFHQYFFNSYGQFGYITIKHLNLIKAFKSSNLLEKAISQVNIEKLNIDEFRTKIYNRQLSSIVDFEENLFNYLESLDNEYDVLDENLEQLLIDFITSTLP